MLTPALAKQKPTKVRAETGMAMLMLGRKLLYKEALCATVEHRLAVLLLK
jgi:hypothetical protein